MEFRIADTFLDSLARLRGDEQKQAKITAFDLQANPANPGHQLHKVDRARDKNFWSVRVGSDIRLIVHKIAGSLLLCYVDHHDKAYSWAERRRLEVHPRTGAAQLIEVREKVQELVRAAVVEASASTRHAKRLFEGMTATALLGLGVPESWIDEVMAADEDHFFEIATHLPAEAAEALLEIAAGGRALLASVDDGALSLKMEMELEPVEIAMHSMAEPSDLSRSQDFASAVDDEQAVLAEALEHPDSQRRFRLIQDHAELERALESPWDRWTVFLHPDQKEIVERRQNGPARVSGSAGTGKTIVALHRAVFLVRQDPEVRVLLTTFSDQLANALSVRLRRLVGNEPRLAERIDVIGLDTIGVKLYRTISRSEPNIVTRERLRDLLSKAKGSAPGVRAQPGFLIAEWNNVVDAWGIKSWEDYRDVQRLGRRTRLSEERRRQLWSIYSQVLQELKVSNQLTPAMMYSSLADALRDRPNPPYDHVIVDEAQDVGVAQLKFLAALGSHRPDALFFAGDMGQRIFQQPFSWRSLGVDVRGRSRVLHVNYRTSHQIRAQADRLLGPKIQDADGSEEWRNETVSLFNGPAPVISAFEDEDAEFTAVAEWIGGQLAGGVAPHEIGLFVRSEEQIRRARSAAEAAKLPHKVLDDNLQIPGGFASIGTMHLAKGLEFKAVAVMACDDEVLPLQERLEAIGEDGDLAEAYDSERQLLYVACTRARDVLMVSGVAPVSEFLADLEHG